MVAIQMIERMVAFSPARFHTGRAWLTVLSAVLITVTLCCRSCSAWNGSDEGRQQTLEGLQAFERGALDQAVSHWEKAAKFCHAQHDSPGEIDSQVCLAHAYEALGQFSDAIKLLHDAVDLAVAAKDNQRIILTKGSLGEAYSFTHRSDLAESNLREALALAFQDGDQHAAARIDNSLGNLLASQDKFADALDAYRQSASLARQTQDRLLTAKALGNAASIAVDTAAAPYATSLNDSACEEARQVQDSHEKAFILTICGQTYQRLLGSQPGSQDLLFASATNAYSTALQTALTIGDDRAASYALGELGRLYEQDSRYTEALDLTRQAVFFAQKTQAKEALYRWEWQTGRLLKALNQPAAAIKAYSRAVQSLHGIRNDLFLTYANRPVPTSFRETIGPVYYELADLLLRQADTLKDDKQIQQCLLEARDVVEQLKSAELEDYFQDKCVNLARKTRVENVSRDAAVIYLIPLPDRTEVLVGFSTGLQKLTVPVGSQRLATVVQQFRKNLETRTSYEYLEQARELYDWLIRPMKEELVRRKIQTLVFIPDGALQTIPFAALQDGQRFLIEDFAVAVTPGLTLTASRSARRADQQMLLAGLSQAAQTFPPLDYVPTELQNLKLLYRGEELLDKDFLKATFEKDFEQKQYSIVHIASHGQFEPDISKTFILTYDTNLNLDALEHLIRPSQFRKEPVELLTLSACETAEGDDRAALGLAGVAVKAGAHSALATLWSVNDQASTFLISEFYSHWASDRSISKARALQLAQITMLAHKRYHHPCYWAPYLLIGNWL